MTSRTRRICPAVAVAIAAMALPAAAPAAVDPWEGTWSTVHQFGHPTLKLKQEPKGEPGPQVHGTFLDDNGVKAGNIRGDLSDKGRVWTGTYNNNQSKDKGKFKVELTAIDVFDGWFKTCGRFTCSSKYDWTGTHA